MEISRTQLNSLPATADRLLRQADRAAGAQNEIGIQRDSDRRNPGIREAQVGIGQGTASPAAVRAPSAEELAARERQVLRPSAVPVEDRLEQVMSLEDVQRLLLLRNPMPNSPGLSGAETGQLLDFRG